MALQPDIQYVNLYAFDGSAARKVQRQPVKKVTAAPKAQPRRAKRKVIAVDPVAICGIVVAVIMMVMMLSAYAEFNACQDRNRQMQDYLSSLQLENAQLQQSYEGQIDMEYVEEVAGALGMVPAGEANEVQIEVRLPEAPVQQLNLWQSITTFLSGLFA
jgi:cell division protein FtsL